MSKELRMDEKGWYKFYFNSKPDEYGEVYKYEIHFQYRTGTDDERIFNSVKMLNDCEEDILYFDDVSCKVSKIMSVPTKHTIIGVKGSIEFLNKVLKRLKENDGCMCDIWRFNEKHYNTSMDELMKLAHSNQKITDKYNSLFNDVKIYDGIKPVSAFKEFIKNKYD